MTKLNDIITEALINEMEDGVFDDDDDIVSYLSDGESEKVVIHDETDDDDADSDNSDNETIDLENVF